MSAKSLKVELKRPKREPLVIGTKYGKYTMIEDLGKNYRGRAFVKAQCECGHVVKLEAYKLRGGEQLACKGCDTELRKRYRSKNGNFRGVGEVGATEYHVITRNAKRKNIPINVSIEYLSELYDKQGHKCAISGLPLKIKRKTSENSASLDRIDSKQGYIEGNVQWVDKRINMMKHALPQEEFVHLCGVIYFNNLKEQSNVRTDAVYDGTSGGADRRSADRGEAPRQSK